MLKQTLTDQPVDTATGYSNGRIVKYILVVAALGVVVFFNYYFRVMKQMEDGKLPFEGKIEKEPPVVIVDQTGQERRFHDLIDKVWVVSQVYTTCPAKCAGMAEEMAKLQAEFAADPRVHFVSLCIYPEHDRPEVLKSWVDARLGQWEKFKPDQWWFLTTKDATEEAGNGLRKYAAEQFKFVADRNTPEHIAKNPADVWKHQFMMQLISPGGNVRGRYYPFHEAFEGNWVPRPIGEDIPKLLKEMDEKKAE